MDLWRFFFPAQFKAASEPEDVKRRRLAREEYHRWLERERAKVQARRAVRPLENTCG